MVSICSHHSIFVADVKRDWDTEQGDREPLGDELSPDWEVGVFRIIVDLIKDSVTPVGEEHAEVETT